MFELASSSGRRTHTKPLMATPTTQLDKRHKRLLDKRLLDKRLLDKRPRRFCDGVWLQRYAWRQAPSRTGAFPSLLHSDTGEVVNTITC